MEDETLINQTADVKKFHNPSHQFIPKFLKRIDKGKKNSREKTGEHEHEQDSHSSSHQPPWAAKENNQHRENQNQTKKTTRRGRRRWKRRRIKNWPEFTSLSFSPSPDSTGNSLHFTASSEKKKVSGRIAGSSGRPGRRGEEWDRVRGEPENQKNSRNILKRISGAEGGDFNKRHEEAAQCNKFSRGVFTERGMWFPHICRCIPLGSNKQCPFGWSFVGLFSS